MQQVVYITANKTFARDVFIHRTKLEKTKIYEGALFKLSVMQLFFVALCVCFFEKKAKHNNSCVEHTSASNLLHNFKETLSETPYM